MAFGMALPMPSNLSPCFHLEALDWKQELCYVERITNCAIFFLSLTFNVQISVRDFPERWMWVAARAARRFCLQLVVGRRDVRFCSHDSWVLIFQTSKKPPLDAWRKLPR